MIYVAATSMNTLFRIDPITLTKAFETRLFCEGAHSFKMDENRQYIYIADSHGRSLSAVDMIKEERNIIGVGTSPSHLVVCRRNGTIYTVNYDSDSISVIDLESLACLLTIKTGSMPHHICLSLDESCLYVSQMGNNRISVIDTEHNRTCGFVDLEATPMHMQVGELTGRIYAACTNFEKSASGEIIVLEKEDLLQEEEKQALCMPKKKSLKRYTVGKYLSDLCVIEEKEMLYALDGQENRLYALDLRKGNVTRETVTGEFPSTIAYDRKTDRLIVGTHISNTIEGYERETLDFAGQCKIEGDFGHISG